MDESYIDPSRENFAKFKALPRDTPIHMLNLVRFKDKATYPEGHELAGKGLTGAQAYAEYMRTIQPVLARSGGQIVWAGATEIQHGVTITAEPFHFAREARATFQIQHQPCVGIALLYGIDLQIGRAHV